MVSQWKRDLHQCEGNLIPRLPRRSGAVKYSGRENFDVGNWTPELSAVTANFYQDGIDLSELKIVELKIVDGSQFTKTVPKIGRMLQRRTNRGFPHSACN